MRVPKINVISVRLGELTPAHKGNILDAENKKDHSPSSRHSPLQRFNPKKKTKDEQVFMKKTSDTLT